MDCFYTHHISCIPLMPVLAFHSLWCTLLPFGQFRWWWHLFLNSTIVTYGTFYFRYVLLPLRKCSCRVRLPPRPRHPSATTNFNDDYFRNFVANQKSTQQTISEAKNTKRRGLITLSFACISSTVSKGKLQFSTFETWICYCNHSVGFLIVTNWFMSKYFLK